MKIDVKIPYRGRWLPVRVQYMRHAEGPSFDYRSGALYLTIPVDRPVYTWELVNAQRKFYEQRSSGTLRERVLNIGERMNIYVFPVEIRELDKGWASHDREGNLTLDWRLLSLPERCVEFAIASELLELKRGLRDIEVEELFLTLKDVFSLSMDEVREVYTDLMGNREAALEGPAKIAQVIYDELGKYRPKNMDLYVLRSREKGYLCIHDDQIGYMDEGYKGTIFSNSKEASHLADALMSEGVIDVVRMQVLVGETVYRNQEQTG